MGFDDDYWTMSDDEMLLEFYDWSAPQLQGITLDLLKEKGWMRLNVGAPGERAPHAEGGFKTPSGKCEFKSSLAAERRLRRAGLALDVRGRCSRASRSIPLPAYIPPFESPASNPALAQRYPLSIVSPKPHAFLNTQYGNEQQKKLRQGEQIVFLHPERRAPRARSRPATWCGCSTSAASSRGRPSSATI